MIAAALLLSREFGQQENGDLNNRYVGKLKDYFHLSSGSTPSSTNRAFYSGNIRWVSSGELKPKYLCETSQHISSEAVSSCNLREYPANTLLVTIPYSPETERTLHAPSLPLLYHFFSKVKAFCCIIENCYNLS